MMYRLSVVILAVASVAALAFLLTHLDALVGAVSDACSLGC